ncbi:MAG: peptidase [Oscillatoria sp. Prado101]|jgi:predicted Zn-dependent protease|nr:peptidase [Oscillatoria sp. Prado101]
MRWLRPQAVFLLAIFTSLLVIFTHSCLLAAKATDGFYSAVLPLSSTEVSAGLPPPLPHTLPPSLAQWRAPANSGDYFERVTAGEVGHLVWSQFPVKVYVQPPDGHLPGPPSGHSRQEQRVSAVLQAVREWGVYLPLEVVADPEIADIAIWHRQPSLRLSPTGTPERARSAETRYELYISQPNGQPAILSHRCTIFLSPNQQGAYIQAAARHEFGHALGIWGHSPSETDALYFSQVRNPPPISPRDVNTLKRVYEQPTRLGWPVNVPLRSQPPAATRSVP